MIDCYIIGGKGEWDLQFIHLTLISPTGQTKYHCVYDLVWFNMYVVCYFTFSTIYLNKNHLCKQKLIQTKRVFVISENQWSQIQKDNRPIWPQITNTYYTPVIYFWLKTWCAWYEATHTKYKANAVCQSTFSL